MIRKIFESKLSKISIVIFLFLLSLAVFYYPIKHKGYAPTTDVKSLVIAKNLFLTGQYSLKDSKEVILTPELLKSQSVPAGTENKLTPLLHANIFKLFGFRADLPMKVSIIFFGLTSLILTILVWRLFDFKLALIFNLVFIFFPIVVNFSIIAGHYEFALFFFSLALLFYLWDFREVKKSYLRMVLSSIFFALAFLARNVFLISFTPFIIYDFFQTKSWKRFFVIILPFLLISSFLLIPDFLAGKPNIYSSLGRYFGQETTISGYNGHCFPDSYTYFFEKDKYVAENVKTASGDVAGCLADYGYDIGFKKELSIYFNSFIYYVKNFFKLQILGGPLVILLMIFGLFSLRKENKKLMNLFIIWFIFWFFPLIYLQSSNFDHFLEIVFPITLLISIGIYYFIDFISEKFYNWQNKNIFVLIFLLIFIFGHLIVADKWMFHERYETAKLDQLPIFNKVLENEPLKSSDVIASSSRFLLNLNYLTGKNFIYFDYDSIKNLLKQNKLQPAFDFFGVNYIIGYDEQLTNEILSKTKIKNISLYEN